MWMVSCADPRTGCRSRRVKCVRLFDLGVFQVFETKALVCFQERVLAPFPVWLILFLTVTVNMYGRGTALHLSVIWYALRCNLYSLLSTRAASSSGGNDSRVERIPLSCCDRKFLRIDLTSARPVPSFHCVVIFIHSLHATEPTSSSAFALNRILGSSRFQ